LTALFLLREYDPIYTEGMKKLYDKSEISFAVVQILIYVIGSSFFDSISPEMVPKAFTFPFLAVFGLWMYWFISKNHLKGYYGFQKSPFASGIIFCTGFPCL